MTLAGGASAVVSPVQLEDSRRISGISEPVSSIAAPRPTWLDVGFGAFSAPLFDFNIVRYPLDRRRCGPQASAMCTGSSELRSWTKLDGCALADRRLEVRDRPSVYSNPAGSLRRPLASSSLLSCAGHLLTGIAAGDYPRFGRGFWEHGSRVPGMAAEHRRRFHALRREASTSSCGRTEKGALARSPGASSEASACGQTRESLVSQMGSSSDHPVTGESFDNNTAVLAAEQPSRPAGALGLPLKSDYARQFAQSTQSPKVSNQYF